MFDNFIKFVRELYQTSSFIPLHEPSFSGNEKKYLSEVIDSTYVSSVGESIVEFESKIAQYVGIEFAVAVVNCTSALHLSLLLSDVTEGTEVITQSLNFVAGSNAISYCKAKPVFIDISKRSLSMSPESLQSFLDDNCEVRDDGLCWNKITGNRVSACLPMNTYGFVSDAVRLNKLCEQFNIPLVEDSAESLGSFYKNKHTGSESSLSTISFNGNKVITTGGGGMILTNNENLYKKAKHISTTAKLNHKWNFNHNEIGYNYRMPNLNAALGLAQLENLEAFLHSKRLIAEAYQAWGKSNGFSFVKEEDHTQANYWLNCMLLDNLSDRDEFLEYTNHNKVMTRPSWIPMHRLEIYKDCLALDMKNTDWIHDRLVNVPSSPIRYEGNN